LKFSVEVREQEDAAVMYLRGQLVFREEAGSFFCKAIEALSGARQLVLDLSGLQKIDGSGLGELVAVWNSAQAAQCQVKLVAPGRRVASLLSLTNLVSLFEIHPTVDDALLAWNGLPA
jgi:anti-sigma B factor antagonist